MYIAIPHLSPIGLSVIHQADEKHVDVTFQRPSRPRTFSILIPFTPLDASGGGTAITSRQRICNTPHVEFGTLATEYDTLPFSPPIVRCRVSASKAKQARVA